MNKDTINIIMGTLILLIILIGLPIWANKTMNNLVEEENQIEQEIQIQQSNYYWCKSNINYTYTNYDLINHYNMSCSEIQYHIDNWAKVYDTNEEWVSGGFLSSGHYEYSETYTGKGHITLIKSKYVGIYPKDKRCYATSVEGTTNYKETDWVNYYAQNCLNISLNN